ncbi:ferritin-like metal-binding protein YciE [Bradyrhizobium sp. JR6.1]
MPEKDLSALFLDTLKDIYYAEKQIYKALPKMAKAASSDKLRAAFEKHHEETEGQIDRLEKIFELLGKPARGKKCDAIEGIIDEGKEIMDEYADTRRRSILACLPPHRRSSTTKSPAMARSRHGPAG